MPATDVQKIDWEDVQGMVLRGYGKHPYATNLLLQVDDAARPEPGWRPWRAASPPPNAPRHGETNAT